MDLICDDLDAEAASLEAMVVGLDEPTWNTPTPAPGWTIRDQLSHLWFFDRRALLALTDPDAFAADAAELAAAGGTDASVVPGREVTGAELLERWRVDRTELLRVARLADPSTRVVWYGPPMSARSFVTARLMEVWAHGQDVADALGVERVPTERLRHVAHIGVRARPFSYAVRGMSAPDVDVHVALTTPSGETVSWGPPGAPDRVVGPLVDFCLVVTQRRHPADTALEVHGDAAREWIGIAQAFAGPPGPGRAPAR